MRPIKSENPVLYGESEKYDSREPKQGQSCTFFRTLAKSVGNLPYKVVCAREWPSGWLDVVVRAVVVVAYRVGGGGYRVSVVHGAVGRAVARRGGRRRGDTPLPSGPRASVCPYQPAGAPAAESCAAVRKCHSLYFDFQYFNL